jgi:hypothetical protein
LPTPTKNPTPTARLAYNGFASRGVEVPDSVRNVFEPEFNPYSRGKDWVSAARSTNRWALAIALLVLFPVALVGGATEVRLYNDSGRQLPLEWAHNYQAEVDPYNTYDFVGSCLAACEDGDVLVAGTHFAGSYYWLMRVHPDGSLVWFNNYYPYCPQVWLYDMVELASNRYLIVGERDPDYNGSRTWLLCVDGSGQEVWDRFYGDLGRGSGGSFGTAYPDGGAVIVGAVNSSTTGDDLYALRIDSNGTPLWNVTYPNPSPWEWPIDVACATNGSILAVEDVGGLYPSVLLCLESNGTVRWNQTYTDDFISVTSGSGGDYVLMSSTRALCLDDQGHERWSLGLSMSESYGKVAVIASQNTYFLVGSLHLSTGIAYSEVISGLSIDTSGATRWSWAFDMFWTISGISGVAASRDGGLYILPTSYTAELLLLRLPDPPAFSSSSALIAETGYSLLIASAMIVTVAGARYVSRNERRRRTDTDRSPFSLLRATLALQVILSLFWALLVFFYGPVRSYYEVYPGSVDAHTVLLFLTLSPVGIANTILGMLAFTGLQLGLFPLDSHLSLERERRGAPHVPSLLTCTCVVVVIFVAWYAIFFPPYSVMMLPFVNGVMLAGFLPKYLLSRRRGERLSSPQTGHASGESVS